MKKLVITLVCLLTVLSAYPIYFKHIGIQEGLSQLSVMSIYQDDLGRMWFGTREGISMYDGDQTVSFKPSDKNFPFHHYLANFNYPITGDRRGNVLFQSGTALIRYDIYKQQFECVKDNGVSTLSRCRDEVWVAASDSLFQWDKEKKVLRPLFRLEQIKGVIQKVFTSSEEGFWIGTTLWRYFINPDGKP